MALNCRPKEPAAQEMPLQGEEAHLGALPATCEGHPHSWPAIARWTTLVALLALGSLLVLLGAQKPAPGKTPAATGPVPQGTAPVPESALILLRQLRQSTGRDPVRDAKLHLAAGNLFREWGRYAEAAHHCESAVALVSGGGPELASALQSLGQVELRQGHLVDAKRHLERTMVLTEAGGDDTMEALWTLADVRREMGNLVEALHLYDRAWLRALAEQDSVVDQLPLLAAEISQAHMRHGDLDKAFAWLREASQRLEPGRSARASKGTEIVAAKVNSYLGSTHHARGDLAQAVEFYRKALRMQARELIPSHPDLLATRMAMARAMRDAGDSEGALRGLEAVEKTLRHGPQEGPDLSRALLLKSDLLREAQRYDDALRAVEEASKLQAACFQGEDHPEVAVAFASLGSILHDKGRLKEARVKYNMALAANLKTVGATHPETASSYNSLGTLHEDLGDDSQAETYFLKCLEIQLSTVGEASPDVSNTYNNLATLIFRRGAPKEAAQLLRKALRALDAAGVPQANPDRAVYRENLSEVLKAMGSSGGVDFLGEEVTAVA